ncbi:MT-A70-domain-containing protein [Obelidium mucronatum]|nr:MT-A70-domain-containing protein [Obelidium mucronatum]
MLQTSHHSRDPLVHQLLNRHCENKSDQSLKLGFNGSTFMIPPRSAFLISDISTFSFQLESTQFGLVVADPPWPNLSASRSNSYDTMDPYHLFKIPLQSHLAEGAVVVVWITHKPKYRAFVIEKLFSAWGLEFVAEWCWIKTTTKGEPMFDDSLKNRKSYELLLIGRRRYRDVQRQQEVVPIPKLKFFASVPSTNHSQKPFLDSLLAPYLPKDSAKLELFARIVRSDWVCWGNECLKFNEVCFLEER